VEEAGSGVAPADCTMSGGLAPGHRWSEAGKRVVVLRMLRGEPVEALSRELGGRDIPTGAVARQGAFRHRLGAQRAGGRSGPGGTGCGVEAYRGTHDAKRAFVAAGEEAWPFGQVGIVQMSQTVSASSEAVYGVERVCIVWEQGSFHFLRPT
jgi:hypothetical protein